RFALIAAANPCPCGHLGDSRFACRCSLYDLHRYASRLSGPLLDRIDLYVQAERLTADELTRAPDAEPTAPVRARGLAAPPRAPPGPRRRPPRRRSSQGAGRPHAPAEPPGDRERPPRLGRHGRPLPGHPGRPAHPHGGPRTRPSPGPPGLPAPPRRAG